jgi:exosortase
VVARAEPKPGEATGSPAAGNRLGWYVIGLLAAVLYFPTFRWLFETWLNDRFYGHGLLVALVCGWLAHGKLAEVQAAEVRPSRWGIPLVVVGLLMAMVGAIGDIMSLSALSLYPVGIGLMLAARGPAALRPLRFPILYFLFAIPLASTGSDMSGRVFTPMMEFATSCTEQITDLFGLQPQRSGTIIRYPHYTMFIDVPCSGMASLLGLMSLAALMGHLSGARPWRTILLVAAAVPVAVASNMARLTLTALLGVTCGEKLATGFLHEASGVFTFLLGAAILTVIPRGTPSEPEDEEEPAATAGPVGGEPVPQAAGEGA